MNKAVCIIIYRNGMFLSASRKNDHTQFGLIGGSVEDGESFYDAAIRELKEETGLQDVYLERIDERQWGDEHITCYYLMVAKEITSVTTNEELIARDEGILKWCTYEELCLGPFGDYNAVILKHLGGIKYD